MDPIAFLRRQWLLGLLFGATTFIAVDSVRFGDGFGMLCGATAILNAVLLQSNRRHWGEPIAMAALASVVAVLLSGRGASDAISYSVLNVAESVLAAWLFQRISNPREALHSLGWFVRFVLCLGLVAPLTMLPMAGEFGNGHALLTFYAGHALGSLAFTPLALLVTGTNARKNLRLVLKGQKRNLAMASAVTLAVALLVFGQSLMPLLFLPLVAVIFSTFRVGREGAALSIVIVALVGGWATTHGSGPIHLMQLSGEQKLLFFQFYIAVTVMSVLPIAAYLTEREALLRRVRESEGRFRMVVEHSSDLLLHLSPEGRFKFVSPSVQQLVGFAPTDMIGRDSRDFVAEEDREGAWAAHLATLKRPGTITTFSYRGIVADGSTRWFESAAQALVDEDGKTEGVLSVARDVSVARAREDQLHAVAHTDALTGLPNRRAFEALVAARQMAGAKSDCIALLDLDRFKSVNDTHGHDAGDAVLKGFAEVARSLVRGQDTVARLGGEEFVILFEDTSIDQAYGVCDRMRMRLGKTELATPAGPLTVTASGGVAMVGPDGLIPALKAADEALYRAKKAGRDQLLLAA